ncbi:uncharacterized protein LOC133928695 [Phragmites australis]|uniref:uncharacterized protein LOC133928695 n=1 Tax=Phragmites australis TaxID=29695 RepID=UPI002D7877CF|nr:uncharacterized protein LOC133928695 [Phragmites australis]
MAAAAPPRVPISSSSARHRGPARPSLLSAAAAPPGWRRRREPYPAVSIAAGSAQSPPGALTVDPTVDTLLDSVKWDSKGLAVAIVQNMDTTTTTTKPFSPKQVGVG